MKNQKVTEVKKQQTILQMKTEVTKAKRAAVKVNVQWNKISIANLRINRSECMIDSFVMHK